MRPQPRRPVLVLMTVICVAVTVGGQRSERASRLLRTHLTLTPSELSVVERGRAVAKSLRAGDRREIAAGGAVRVGVPARFFLQKFVDIVSFKQSPIVRQIGKFSETPRRDDLAGLTFDPGDLDEIRSCRVGDCDIQLSAEQIRRIQGAVDWSRPDAPAQANRVLRDMLFDYVELYQRAGNQALLEYADDDAPLRVNDELRLLVAHSRSVLSGLPEFGELLSASSSQLQPANEFLYWSKEQFGLKPVVSITHVIVYLPGRPDVPDIVIASKQIYASRYLAASLALTFGVEPSPGTPAFYMAYVNRTRPRAFPPVIGGLVRRVAQGQTRDGLEEQLQLAKARLEGAYRNARLLNSRSHSTELAAAVHRSQSAPLNAVVANACCRPGT